MRIVTLWSGATASANAAITYQCPVKMRLDTIFANASIVATGGGPAAMNWEVSLQSTAQLSTNDPVGVIAVFRFGTALLSQQNASSALYTPIGFQFEAGDRIYINMTAGNVSSQATNFGLVFN